MLVAWARGKRRGARGEFEDEILSAIFGPLLCASHEQRVEVFRRIGLSCGINSLRDKHFQSCELSFWPNLAAGGRVEPDLVVTLVGDRDGQEVMLAVEAKWDSGQSEGQLVRQWDSIGKHGRYGRSEAWHIYLTKEPHSSSQMLGSGSLQEHQDRLRSLTWSRLGRVLGELPFLSEWASFVGRFLSGLGHPPFVGVQEVTRKHDIDRIDFGNRWTFRLSLMRLPELLNNYDGLISSLNEQPWKFQGQKA